MSTAIKAIFGADTKQLDRSMDRLKKGAGGLKSAFGQIGLGLSAGLLAGKFKGLNDELAETGRKARVFGVGTDFLQEMSFAANMVGADMQKITDALAHMSERLGDARRGNKAYREEFEKAGISLDDVNGKAKSNEQVFRELSEAIRTASDSSQQMFIASELLGDSQGELVDFLRKGKKGLDEYAKAARDAGAVIESKLIKQAEEFDEQMKTMSTQAKSLGFDIMSLAFTISEGLGGGLGMIVSDTGRLVDGVKRAEFSWWNVVSPITAVYSILKGVSDETNNFDKQSQDAAKNREAEAMRLGAISGQDAERNKRISELRQKFDKLEQDAIWRSMKLETQRYVLQEEINDLDQQAVDAYEDKEKFLELILEKKERENRLAEVNQKIEQETARERAESERERKKAADERRKALEDEQRREQSILDIRRDLAILEARAAGDEERATQLERYRDLAEDVERIMEETGVSEEQATKIAKRRLELMEKIAKIAQDENDARGGGDSDTEGKPWYEGGRGGARAVSNEVRPFGEQSYVRDGARAAGLTPGWMDEPTWRNRPNDMAQSMQGQGGNKAEEEKLGEISERAEQQVVHLGNIDDAVNKVINSMTRK